MKTPHGFIFVWLFLGFSLLNSCNRVDQEDIRSRMQNWDNGLWEKTGVDDTASPKRILDSLSCIKPGKLSHENRAYYHLLQTIAQDKSYFVFQSDSLIALAVKWYQNDNDVYNYTRSLFYHSIVLSQIHTNDSLMFFTIKKAEEQYIEKELNDSLLYARICVFMGSLHYSRGNYVISNDYYEKSADIFKAIGNTDRYISAKMNQVWYLLSIEKLDTAYRMLQTLDYPENISQKALSYIYNVYCGYYTAKKDYTKAIEYAKINFSLDKVSKTPEDSSAHYYSLARNYSVAGIADSAIYYSNKLEQTLKENNPNNHHYYMWISNAYSQGGFPDLSNHYLKKAYLSLRNNIYDNSQRRILELEKKYDISRKEYELIKATHNNNILLSALVFFFLVFIVLMVSTYLYRKLQKQKAILIQEEKDHFATINILQKKAINMFPHFIEMINSVLQKHFKFELQEDLNNTIYPLKVLLINELSSLFPVKNDLIDLKNLSEKEQLIFLLNEYGFSNAEIANILLITEGNVRSTKSKIKKKSETF